MRRLLQMARPFTSECGRRPHFDGGQRRSCGPARGMHGIGTHHTVTSTSDSSEAEARSEQARTGRDGTGLKERGVAFLKW